MKFATVRMHFLRDLFRLLSTRNFVTMATWRNDFSSLLEGSHESKQQLSGSYLNIYYFQVSCRTPSCIQWLRVLTCEVSELSSRVATLFSSASSRVRAAADSCQWFRLNTLFSIRIYFEKMIRINPRMKRIWLCELKICWYNAMFLTVTVKKLATKKKNNMPLPLTAIVAKKNLKFNFENNVQHENKTSYFNLTFI